MTERPTRVTRIRPAGDDHQVVTVVGGAKRSYRRKPCPTCPWRLDAVGEFPAEAFRHSANTSYDMSGHTFACHQSGTRKPAICAGFILRGGAHNLGLRLKLYSGEVDLARVHGGGCDLHENYREMAVANGVSPDDPVLQPCRDDTRLDMNATRRRGRK